ncbi:MAG TPA: 7TM-DISM domain-containing protein, partial [Fibrobacteraceae bacterium]|nr:7TM-DISM domain-containing protein [Fibrobacteraceae bacterium]
MYTSRDSIYLGFYFGIFFILLLFSLSSSLFFRNRTQTYFLLFLIFSSFWNLIFNGYADEFIWPNTPVANFWLMVSLTLFCPTFVLFVSNFLRLSQNFPWVDRLLRVFVVLLFVPSLFFLGGDHYRLFFNWSMPWVFLLLVILFVCSVILSLRAQREAQIFFASWTVLFVGSILYILKVFGILHSSLWTDLILHMGVLFLGII